MVEMYVRLILHSGWSFDKIPTSWQNAVEQELNKRGYDRNRNLLSV